eukprot:TRINITY_DN1214_c0_g1_i1.p1 TRINITY_DN1214_c0_g1~~TRINITY_DN1214_c0_g1_i1.p1  ORF type:complete len:443 (-),score=17.41 TRINITY_DN1214_c0_g1_i1:14-1342(-)
MSGSKGKLKSSVSVSSLDQWSRALNFLKNNSILDIDSEQDSELESQSSIARCNKEMDDDEMFSCKEVFSKEEASSEDDRSNISANSRVRTQDPKADRRRAKRTPEISSSRASNDGPQRIMDMASFDFSNQKTKSARESKLHRLDQVDKRRSLPSSFVHNSNVTKPAQNNSPRSAAKSPRTLSVLPRSSPKTFCKIITYRSSVNGDGERADSTTSSPSSKPRSKSLKDLPSNKIFASEINTQYSIVKSPKQSRKAQRVPFPHLSGDDLLSGSHDESEEGKNRERRGPRRAASALPKLEKLRALRPKSMQLIELHNRTRSSSENIEKVHKVRQEKRRCYSYETSSKNVSENKRWTVQLSDIDLSTSGNFITSKSDKSKSKKKVEKKSGESKPIHRVISSPILRNSGAGSADVSPVLPHKTYNGQSFLILSRTSGGSVSLASDRH